MIHVFLTNITNKGIVRSALNMFKTGIIERRMNVSSDNVKEQLIEATIKLLNNGENTNKITARKIVAEANVNLSMINYYFNSKDALINCAVGKILEEKAEELMEIRKKDLPAEDMLREFLVKISDNLIKYADIVKPSIPYILLQGNFEQTYQILPLVKKCLSDQKSELECRVIAYQLVSFMQLVFYRSEEFMKYSGVDIYDENQRNQMIIMQLKLLLPGNLHD